MEIFDKEDVDTRLTDLGTELAEIKATLEEVREYIVRADKTIATVAEQVMPTIDQLTKSPLLKMLGVNKK
jgi:uncharacterized coiled-coil protein SlyX